MSFMLAAAGDIIVSSGLDISSLDVLAHVREADLATANLEVVVSTSRAAADKMICLGIPPSFMGDVAALGFQVVSVANNHALDFGIEGLRDTLAHVREAGLAAVGGGENLAESISPHVTEANGKLIAIFGASSTLPNGSAAGPSTPGIAPIRVINRYRIDGVTMDEAPGMAPFVETEAVAADVERLCASIRKVSGDVDLVVVHLHWGLPPGWVAPFQDEIAQYQRPVAHALIDAGAGIIVGHHPHVVQAVEFYEDAPILYSLGNFIMHPVIPKSGNREGIHPPYRLATLTGYWNAVGCVAQINWDGGGGRPRCTFIVTQLGANGEPFLADQATASELERHLSKPCAALGTKMEMKQRANGAVLLEFS